VSLCRKRGEISVRALRRAALKTNGRATSHGFLLATRSRLRFGALAVQSAFCFPRLQRKRALNRKAARRNSVPSTFPGCWLPLHSRAGASPSTVAQKCATTRLKRRCGKTLGFLIFFSPQCLQQFATRKLRNCALSREIHKTIETAV